MGRDVPGLPELADSLGIPPVLVESPVCKHQQLPQQVEGGMEQEIEAKKPE